MHAHRPRRARVFPVLAFVGAFAGALVNPVGVAAAGQPVALEFAVQPGGGPAGVLFARQPVVKVVDASGDTVTTSSAPVYLTQVAGFAPLGCGDNPVRAIN